jgi:MoxR-like ATPase
MATLEDRDYVLPDDVQRVAPLVLQHRVVGAKAGEMNFAAHRETIDKLIAQIRVPV